MPYYPQPRTITGANGTTLTVQIKEDLDRVLVESLPGIVDEARRLLHIANTIVSRAGPPSPAMVALAHLYFRTGEKEIPAAKWTTIKDVILKTQTGLSGHVWLKAAKTIHGKPDVGGRVNRHYDGAKKGTEATFSNWVTNHNPLDKDLDGVQPNMRWGAIQLSARGIADRGTGVLTLIHEATHKFAGTFDFAYFKNEKRGEEEITGHVFDEKSDLTVWNADSYAWFVVKLAGLGPQA